jgi:hypothetical protein
MSSPSQYGRFYFCIGLTDGKKKTEVYVYADEVKVEPSGALVALQRGNSEIPGVAGESPTINVAFAPGQWTYVYGASVIDGAAVAVEHWPGQIAEPTRGKGRA